EILTELKGHAEYIIADGAPLLLVTDSYAFAASTESVVVVVRNKRTSASAVQTVAETLFQRLRVGRVHLVVTGIASRSGISYDDYASARSRRTPKERLRSES